MTIDDLLSEMPTHHGRLLADWRAGVDRCNTLGLLVFLPDGYANAAAFGEVGYDFWTLDYSRVYLEVVEKDEITAALLENFDGFEGTEDFLVMVLGSSGNTDSPCIAVQRIWAADCGSPS